MGSPTSKMSLIMPLSVFLKTDRSCSWSWNNSFFCMVHEM